MLECCLNIDWMELEVGMYPNYSSTISERLFWAIWEHYWAIWGVWGPLWGPTGLFWTLLDPLKRQAFTVQKLAPGLKKSPGGNTTSALTRKESNPRFWRGVPNAVKQSWTAGGVDNTGRFRSHQFQFEGVERKKVCQLRQETEAHLARQLSQRLQRKF